MLKITEGLNRDVRDSSNASNDAVCNALCSALAFRTLQSELLSLYGRFGVETSVFLAPQMLRQFLGAVLDTIAELPLEFPADVGQETRQGSQNL